MRADEDSGELRVMILFAGRAAQKVRPAGLTRTPIEAPQSGIADIPEGFLAAWKLRSVRSRRPRPNELIASRACKIHYLSFDATAEICRLPDGEVLANPQERVTPLALREREVPAWHFQFPI